MVRRQTKRAYIMNKNLINILIPLGWLVAILAISIWLKWPMILAIFCAIYIIWTMILFKLDAISQQIDDKIIKTNKPPMEDYD